jgi:hypothetical protein
MHLLSDGIIIALHMIIHQAYGAIGERHTWSSQSTYYIYDRFCLVYIRLALHMDGSTVDLPVYYLDLMHLCLDCKHTVQYTLQISECMSSPIGTAFLVQTR